MNKVLMYVLSVLVIGGVATAGILGANIVINPDGSYTKTEEITVTTHIESLDMLNSKIAIMEKCKSDKEYLESYNTNDARLGEAIMVQIKELDGCAWELEHYKALRDKVKDIK